MCKCYICGIELTSDTVQYDDQAFPICDGCMEIMLEDMAKEDSREAAEEE